MNTYTCKCPACGKKFPLSFWNSRRICLNTGKTVRIIRVKEEQS